MDSSLIMDRTSLLGELNKFMITEKRCNISVGDDDMIHVKIATDLNDEGTGFDFDETRCYSFDENLEEHGRGLVAGTEEIGFSFCAIDFCNIKYRIHLEDFCRGLACYTSNIEINFLQCTFGRSIFNILINPSMEKINKVAMGNCIFSNGESGFTIELIVLSMD